MFDFRYHAISLIAVLLSLVIGLLLGIAIGDKELVSSEATKVREDLRAEVEEARGESRALDQALEQRDRYGSETLPLVVGNRLQGRDVAVLLLHEPAPATYEEVKSAVETAGGDVSSVARLELPIDLERIAELAHGGRYSDLASDPELIEPFGRRIGNQLVTGGRLLDRVAPALISSVSGELGDADAVVVVRGEPPERSRPAARVEDDLVGAILEGIDLADAPIVGVERTDTDPSQVKWYDDQDIASVDSVDLASGRAALVFALAERSDGAYGVKPSAGSLLPETVLPRR